MPVYLTQRFSIRTPPNGSNIQRPNAITAPLAHPPYLEEKWANGELTFYSN